MWRGGFFSSCTGSCTASRELRVAERVRIFCSRMGSRAFSRRFARESSSVSPLSYFFLPFRYCSTCKHGERVDSYLILGHVGRIKRSTSIDVFPHEHRPLLVRQQPCSFLRDLAVLSCEREGLASSVVRAQLCAFLGAGQSTRSSNSAAGGIACSCRKALSACYCTASWLRPRDGKPSCTQAALLEARARRSLLSSTCSAAFSGS